MSQNMPKRQDIQGLRAWAIILVILFHYFPDSFPNGYVGVDMFFVISGYLIGMIICKFDNLDMESLRIFYYRRIKRIFPLYYLVIAMIFCAMYELLPNSFFTPNSESGLKATLLTTNFKDADDTERNYEVLLNNAEDLFTHTWSLCVEIQWYLLVPLIFIVQRATKINGMVFFVGIGLMSLIFNLSSNDSTAFNSVFARIWQFASGVTAHFITNRKANNHRQKYEDQSKEPLIQDGDNNEGKENQKGNIPNELEHLLPYISNFLFILILVTFSWSTEEPHHLRIEMTFLTAVLIAIGEYYESPSLANPVMNYIGNISYSLYLVHWPVYIIAKHFFEDSQIALTFGIMFSLWITMAIYHFYEQPYLKLSENPILTIIGVLFVVSLLLTREKTMTKILGKEDLFSHYSFNHTRGDPSKNLSIAISIDYQEGVANMGINKEASPECQHIQLTLNKRLDSYGICEYQQKLTGKFKMLVVGNSFACNQGGVIFDEFKNYASKFIVSCEPACEVLSDRRQHPICGGWINQPKVFETVKPDILFIIQKILIGKTPYNKSEPLAQDSIYQAHLKKLKYFEDAPWVKKIYLLTAMPDCVHSCATAMISFMAKEHKPLKEAGDRFAIYDDQPGRERYEQLEKDCKKCELVDLKAALSNDNGNFTMYDEATNLVYLDNYTHLTKYGKDIIRPFYREVAKDFAKEFAKYLKPKLEYAKITRKTI